MLPRMIWIFVCVEVLLESTQESVGHLSGAGLHAVLKEDWPYFPRRSGPFARVKQLKYFWNLHKKDS